MPQELSIFRALRQQMLWPSIHAAVDVYQRRRVSADHYELIWRLIHICECTIITLASAAISRIRETENRQDYLKLRERCYGLTWNSAEGSLEKGQGALDGSVDKWAEVLQLVASFPSADSKFLATLQTFLAGRASAEGSIGSFVDLAPLVHAWRRACDVPPSVNPKEVSVKEAFQAINSFRNRFAHVPFPYDQLEDIYPALEACTFRIFEIPPTAANEESPLSGYFVLGSSVLRGPGYCRAHDGWSSTDYVRFAWGKQAEPEVWDARPFVFLDKMMRPYLLSRLKNEAGSWEYIRYLAEANAVNSISTTELLQFLPRPNEADYQQKPEEDQTLPSSVQVPEVTSAPGKTQTCSREEAFAAVKERNFEPAIEYWKAETERKPYYHSGWQRLGFAQREYAVDLMETNEDRAKELLRDSIESFSRVPDTKTPSTRQRHTTIARNRIGDCGGSTKMSRSLRVPFTTPKRRLGTPTTPDLYLGLSF